MLWAVGQLLLAVVGVVAAVLAINNITNRTLRYSVVSVLLFFTAIATIAMLVSFNNMTVATDRERSLQETIVALQSQASPTADIRSATNTVPQLTSTSVVAAAPTLEIDPVRDKGNFPHIATISGTYKNVTSDTDIWIYVAVSTQEQYFVFKALKIGDGIWEARDVTVGLPESGGQPFRIGAFTANEAASAKLEKSPAARDSLPPGTLTFKDKEIVVIRAK